MDTDKPNNPSTPGADSASPRPFSDIQAPKKPEQTPIETPKEPQMAETPPEPAPVDEDTDEATESDAPSDKPEAGKPADPKTDEAIDDITKQEADDALKAQDEVAEHAFVMKLNPWEKFKNFIANIWDNPRKRYSILIVIALLIIVPLAVPFTRFNILGLFMKAPVTVQVLDNKGAAVSGALVKIGSVSGQTEANGKVTIKANAGTKTIDVSKKYYEGSKQSKLITLSGSKNNFSFNVKALGQPVKVTIYNRITDKPARGVTIAFKGASAKTNDKGVATVVIASGAKQQAATVSGGGLGQTKVILVASDDLKKNTFKIVPEGKIYFLSNLSGKLDVVKTNLDGTDRQTVLAGTGNEDRNSTSLLASRDWKYLALLSRRAGEKASVYLIDTTKNDKLTTIDEGNAEFTLVGWSDNRFVYQVNRNTMQDWQSNKYAIKSFNAQNGQTLLLDQNQASGTNQNDYVKQSFGTAYIVEGQVIYPKNWDANYNNASALTGKQVELSSIGADGTGHKTVKSFTPETGSLSSNLFLNTQLYQPSELYIAFQGGSKQTFYEYEDGKVTEDKEMTSEKFYNTPYPTFLQSPTGKSTFWAEQRDGKNTLFTGDEVAKNSKQVASLSEYTPYGWFSDDYLLVSKNKSELYILPTGGGTLPVKISDYYKPAITYNGYGGGYGGL